MLDTNKVLRIAVSFLGVLISLYTLYVEIHALADKNYKAMCDINENVSCTKVFLSKHGKGFGLIGPILGENSALNLPNPVYGIAFYGFIFMSSFFSSGKKLMGFLTLLSFISCGMCVYLASVLYAMRHVCLVCFSTYAISFALFYLCFKRYNELVKTEKYKVE
uniref:vitamin-K-epoxide reductase (warfarin-sensitive) n=1 Tax=Hydra vulgaris TaxID=6087 RepID=T2M637_HYDVU